MKWGEKQEMQELGTCWEARSWGGERAIRLGPERCLQGIYNTDLMLRSL